MDQIRMIHGSCHFSMGSALRFSHFLPGGKDVFPKLLFRERLSHTLEPYLEPNMHTYLETQETLMGKDRVFCSFCLGTVFFLSFDHMEGWKHPIFKPHEKKIPVCLNYSQAGVKTKENIIAVEFFFNIWPCNIFFIFLKGGHMHVKRPCQRVKHLRGFFSSVCVCVGAIWSVL